MNERVEDHHRLRALFRDTLRRLSPAQRVQDAWLDLPGTSRRVSLVAFGKAAVTMTQGAERALAERDVAIVERVIVAPAETGAVPAGLATAEQRPSWWSDIVRSSHPIPDRRSVAAARAVLEAVRSRAQVDEILALVSGGGSALLALPAAGLSLADKVVVTRALAERGASIDQLNIVRKHLSAIKGGQLARVAAAPMTSLIISDVVGDDLATIASGPTVADASTFAQAVAVVERYLGWQAIPPSVRHHLQRGVQGLIEDTPGESRPRDRVVLVAGMGALATAARETAEAMGMSAEIAAPSLTGDVVEVARRLGSLARQMNERRPSSESCMIAGGEPTIALPLEPGCGGRAHQLALLMAQSIAGLPGVCVLIAGSDGLDGNSGAAGAIVDGATWQKLQVSGVDGERALRECDAGTALAAVDAQIRTGATGVNHADLMIIKSANRQV